MSNRNAKNKIQQAMNYTLSGLSPDAFLAERVIGRAQTHHGEKIMKKKLSGSLVFALILTIVLVTGAFAFTNWDKLRGYFEAVRVMDTEGVLARWSDEDKIKLLSAMAEAGIVSPDEERVKIALDDARPLAERASAANDIITQRYGEDYFDSHTVEQMEFPEAERSPEEQESFGQWSQAYWRQWGDDSQQKRPLTEGRIYRATMNNLTEVGEFPRSLIRDVQVTNAWDDKEQVYLVTASIKKDIYLASKQGPDQASLFDPGFMGYESGDSFCFQFWLDKYGAFLGIKDPHSPEARAKLSLEEAQPIAEKALKVRLNVDAETLNNLPLRAFFSDSGEYISEEGRFRAACTFIWGPEGDARYMVDIDAQTGRVIQAFDWHETNTMMEKEKQWMAELKDLVREAGASETLTNQQGQYIWNWSLAERAAWSQVARPVVHRYLADHPDFAQYLEDVLALRYGRSSDWPNLISLTQHAYGTPDDQAISQEKAFERARAVALERGANQRYVDDNKSHTFFYDVTDPARPLWKVLVSLSFGDGDAAHPYIATAPLGYFVVMDAHTGEVIRVVERTLNTDIRDIV